MKPSPTKPLTALLYCLLGVSLYGFANCLSGKYYLPGCSFAELRPQVVIPMFMGIYYGPWAGFLVGGTGDMLGYAIAGKGLFFAPSWSFANGLMGAIPGLISYWGGRRIASIKSFGRLLILLFMASSIPFLIPIGLAAAQKTISFHEALYNYFLPIFITDTIWAIILIPGLMLLKKMIQMRIELRTILTIHYLIIFSVLATWLCNVVITFQSEVKVEKLYILGGITLIVLMLGLISSNIFAKVITSPLVILTKIAGKVSAGNYSEYTEIEVVTARNDELGTLAKVFLHMIKEVEKREASLKMQVKELEIIIDHHKQESELKKITETDYFKELKHKANELRNKASKKGGRGE